MQPILANARLFYFAVLSALLCLPALSGAATMPSKPQTSEHGQGSTSAPDHWKVLHRYCETCHNTEDWAGGVAFDALDAATIPQDEQTWEKVIRKLRAGMMPPPGKPRPDRRVLDSFAAELASRLDEAQALHPVATDVPVHRLNRTEYANAIRDLLAFDVDIATLLPADDAAEGFDNIADVLNVSPTLVQAYVSAAMKISRWAVGDRSTPPTSVKYVVPPGLSQEEHIEGLPLGTRGGMTVTHNFPLDAEYEFRVSAGGGFRFAGPVGGPAPRVDVTLDGQQVNEPDLRKFRIRVKAGPQKIGVALVEQRHWAGVDGLYSKAQPRRDDLESLTINGPFDATGTGDTPSRRAIFLCHPKEAREEESCARMILTRLATRGLRRPLAAGDPALQLLMDFYRAGRESGDFESGIRTALARLLVEPQFLYRIEAPAPDLAAGTLHKVDDVDLASRLSFFLWSSIPDEQLIDIAAAGHLNEPQVLQQQVRRMLADPRSQALVDNFAGQWLRLRELRGVQPADPEFDENLREALRQETLMLFANIVHEDRSVIDLLDADYTFVNERLARHYGITNVHGSFMRRVNLPHDSPRRGLLGQGSILTVTSAGNRTSPVQRGAWVMEALFGAAVPQPPPGVDQSLKEDPTLARPMTVRERLELHRANPNCAACHQIMDPIGFSLEHFDLDGRWRDLDGTTPIDSSGKLVDGTALTGVNDLRRALLARSDSFVTSMIEKTLMYALGRRIESYDQPAIRKILRDARREDYRFAAIVRGIAQSIPFRMTGAPRALAPGGVRAAGLNTLQSTHQPP
jgi:mono/diheme cytochrome c family protein